MTSDPSTAPPSRRIADRLGIQWPPATDYWQAVVLAGATVLEYLESHPSAANLTIDTEHPLAVNALYRRIKAWNSTLGSLDLTSRMRERALQAALDELSSEDPGDRCP